MIQQGGLHADTPKNVSWQRIETKHTIISYQYPEDLEKSAKKIVCYSPEKSWFKQVFSPSGSDARKNMLKKVDFIFERTQKLLGMKKDMSKLTIKIFPNKEKLDTAYQEIYKRINTLQLRAWYIREYNTIYLNANDLTEGMLAHEMAHAIIDDYLGFKPPKAAGEILARYVDVKACNLLR